MKAVIVFSGFNPRAVVAFLRTLESNNIEYGIIAKSKEDDIFLTGYANKVLAVREVPQLDMNDLTESIKKLQHKLVAEEYVIAPSTEALNRYLLDNRAEFDTLNCVTPLVDNDLYKTISDKHAFGELCKNNGIRVPSEYKSLDSISPPFVAKPKTYFTIKNEVFTPVLIFNEDDKAKFLNEYNPDSFYFQEYIDGSSLYLLYYFYENGDVDKFSQINYVQQPGGKSMIGAIASDLHLAKQSELYEKLFKAVTFRGLVMVEVKRMNGEFYMIEANPRFWGPSQLFVDAGVNLFESFLADYGILSGRPVAMPVFGARYFWQGGIESPSDMQQLTYHDYTATDFVADFAVWQEADVYNRDDTKNLFETEIRRNQ